MSRRVKFNVLLNEEMHLKNKDSSSLASGASAQVVPHNYSVLFFIFDFSLLPDPCAPKGVGSQVGQK